MGFWPHLCRKDGATLDMMTFIFFARMVYPLPPPQAFAADATALNASRRESTSQQTGDAPDDFEDDIKPSKIAPIKSIRGLSSANCSSSSDQGDTLIIFRMWGDPSTRKIFPPASMREMSSFKQPQRTPVELKGHAASPIRPGYDASLKQTEVPRSFNCVSLPTGSTELTNLRRTEKNSSDPSVLASIVFSAFTSQGNANDDSRGIARIISSVVFLTFTVN
mmetsp:Transcript_25426/g.41948  ORF Transcript_25426/g.41948 Transcript_25426/m.41948 type:complete len:221 (+) Transcript_25426:1905-2567(+)